MSTSLDRVRFTQSPDETDRSFFEKLHDQLASSIAPVKQLAAEITWLLLLCPSNISPERKRENVRSVWSWSDLPFPSESKWLTDKALHGIGSGGQAFGHHRPREFTFCIEFLKSFRALSGEDQQGLVKRPWEFADWLQHVPGAATRQFRHMLLYILFPDEFERIFSSVDRRSIVERFCNLSKSSVSRLSPLELDRKLEQARKEAQDKYGTEELDFYRSPLKEQWQFDLAELASTIKPEHVVQAIVDVQATGVPPDARSTTYDLVYEGGRYPPKLVFSLACKHATGTELPRTSFAGGDDTPAFAILRDLGFSIVPKELIGDLVTRFLAQANAGSDLRTSSYPRAYRDLTIKVGFGQGTFTHVPWVSFLAEGQRVSNGIYPVLLYYRQAQLLILAYGVSETNKPASDWTQLGDAPLVSTFLREKYNREAERYGNSFVAAAYEVPAELDIADLTSRLDEMIKVYEASVAPSTGSAPLAAPSPNLVSLDDEIEDLFVDEDVFSLMLGRLKVKKNIILQGPPGVGKTFFARKLAHAFIGAKDQDRIRAIQFHPSYAYEDFVQGYRPDGKGGFERKDGVFFQFCERARADPGRMYAFIIDEINRANLSKVFGELLMLIEHDKRGEEYSVDLAYSTEEDSQFFVPSNVHIIGLMNTADRSLALVDYALRRRFDFFDLLPGFEHPRFTSFLSDQGVPEALILHIKESMRVLNDEITRDADLGRGFCVGHSYFCSLVAVDDVEDAYNSVVDHEVVPLLREYWYEGSRAEDWRLRLLKK